MKARDGVLDYLNQILTNDLTAINQYFLHAEMCRQRGYERLYHKFREMSIEEMRDVERLMEHVLYLEGLPNVQRLGRVEVGESVEEDLRLNLQQEVASAETLEAAVAHCGQAQDFATRGILEQMMIHQAGDIDWLETQLETISQIGIEEYLGHQIKKEE